MAFPVIPLVLAAGAVLYFMGKGGGGGGGTDQPASSTPPGRPPEIPPSSTPASSLPAWLTAPLNPPADMPPVPIYNNPSLYQVRTAAAGSTGAIEQAGQVLGPIVADQLAMSDTSAAAGYLEKLAAYCRAKGVPALGSLLDARAAEVLKGTAGLPAWYGPMTFDANLPVPVRARALYLAAIGRWSVVGDILPQLQKEYPKLAGWLSDAMAAAAKATTTTTTTTTTTPALPPITGATPPAGWPASVPWPGFWPGGMPFPAGTTTTTTTTTNGPPPGTPWGNQPPPGWPANMPWPPTGATPGNLPGGYQPGGNLKLPPNAKWDSKQGVILYTVRDGDWGIDPIMLRFGKKGGQAWLKMVYAYNPGTKFGPASEGGNIFVGKVLRMHESAGIPDAGIPSPEEYMAQAEGKPALREALAQETAAAKKGGKGASSTPAKPGASSTPAKPPPGAPPKPASSTPAKPGASSTAKPNLNTVKGVQEALKALGFDPGPIDGKPGAKTTAAVKAFQKSVGLTVDGKVGPMTRAAIQAKLDAKLARKPGRRPIVEGNHHDARYPRCSA